MLHRDANVKSPIGVSVKFPGGCHIRCAGDDQVLERVRSGQGRFAHGHRSVDSRLLQEGTGRCKIQGGCKHLFQLIPEGLGPGRGVLARNRTTLTLTLSQRERGFRQGRSQRERGFKAGYLPEGGWAGALVSIGRGPGKRLSLWERPTEGRVRAVLAANEIAGTDETSPGLKPRG